LLMGDATHASGHACVTHTRIAPQRCHLGALDAVAGAAVARHKAIQEHDVIHDAGSRRRRSHAPLTSPGRKAQAKARERERERGSTAATTSVAVRMSARAPV
jgi:hypothetical protein